MTVEGLWSGTVPTLGDVFAARKRIRELLPPTPSLISPALSARMGCEVVIKCENLQPIGAFKVRGGVNLLSQMSDDERACGVVAASTGNHGQSIAYAATLFGARAIIFVPNAANPLKVAAMQRFGAEVRFACDDFVECHCEAEQFATDRGMTFVHAANEPRLIEGVATYSLELLEAHPDLDAMFVAVGGGSGLSGACIVGKAVRPELRIFGVVSEDAPAARVSWQERELRSVPSHTFAEGIAVSNAFPLPCSIFWDEVEEILAVSDADLRRSMLTIAETTHMLAEGAGAAALAGLYQKKDELVGKKVGIVVSGGNVTLDDLGMTIAGERAW